MKRAIVERFGRGRARRRTARSTAARVAAHRLLRPAAAEVARRAPAPARRRHLPALARAAGRAGRSARRVRHRGSAPLRGRRRDPLRQGRRRDRVPGRAGRSARCSSPTGAERLIPDEEKLARADFAFVNDGSLDDLDAFASDVMARLTRMTTSSRGRRRRSGRSRAAPFFVEETKPAWYARMRYPLEYEHIVVGHAENYDLDPALLAAVIYRESKFDPKARSSSGAVGLMQLLPDTARGHRRPHGRQRVRRLGPLRPGDQRALRVVLPPPADPQVRRRAARARRLQRRADERGRVDRRRRGIAFPETRQYVDDVLELRRRSIAAPTTTSSALLRAGGRGGARSRPRPCRPGRRRRRRIPAPHSR